MSDGWKWYRKRALQRMRPYVPGESLEGISVNKEDTPEAGGMIAVNVSNGRDQWYVSKSFFEQNYEPTLEVPRIRTYKPGEEGPRE